MKITLLTLLFLSTNSHALEYIFCNSCTSKIEFVNFAKGRYGTGIIPKTYQVINFNTEEIWNVYVEREFEPDGFYDFINAVGTVATSKDIDDFRVAKEIILQKDFIVVIPPGPDQGSYSGTRSETINGYITAHPVFPTLISQIGLFKAIKIAL